MNSSSPDIATERHALRVFTLRLSILFTVYIAADLFLVWFAGYSLPSDVVTLLILMSAALLAGDAYVRRSHAKPPQRRAWRMACLFALFQLLLTTLFTLGLSALGVPMLVVYMVLDLLVVAPWLLFAILLGYVVLWILTARLGMWIGMLAASKRVAVAGNVPPGTR